MGVDIPPNLAGQAASAIVRGVEDNNESPSRKQEEERIKNDGRDGGNASIRRKNEPGN